MLTDSYLSHACYLYLIHCLLSSFHVWFVSLIWSLKWGVSWCIGCGLGMRLFHLDDYYVSVLSFHLTFFWEVPVIPAVFFATWTQTAGSPRWVFEQMHKASPFTFKSFSSTCSQWRTKCSQCSNKLLAKDTQPVLLESPVFMMGLQPWCNCRWHLCLELRTPFTYLHKRNTKRGLSRWQRNGVHHS